MRQKISTLRQKMLTDNALRESVQIDILDKQKKIKLEDTWLKCYLEELRSAYTVPILLLLIVATVLGFMNKSQHLTIIVSLIILITHMLMVYVKNKDYIANKVKAVHKDGIFVDVIKDTEIEQVLVSELCVNDVIRLKQGMKAPCKLRVMQGTVTIDSYAVAGKSIKTVENTVIYPDSTIIDMSDDAEVCVADDINRERRLISRRRFRSKTLKRFFSAMTFVAILGVLFMLLMSSVYALTPYNTVLNIMICIVSIAPLCYMLALINIPSHKNMSFIRYIKGVLCLGTTDIVSFDVKDIVSGDRYKGFDVKFINKAGDTITSSQLNNKKGEVFKQFTQVAKMSLDLIPALTALDVHSSAQGRLYKDYSISEYDDNVIYDDAFEPAIKNSLSQGYMLFVCKIKEEVVGMLCIKHFVTVDMKTLAKVLTKYNVSLQLVSAEPKYYIDSVVAQIQGSKSLGDDMFSVHYVNDNTARREHYKELASAGKSVCHIGNRNYLIGTYGSFSRVGIKDKKGFYIDKFEDIQTLLINAKMTFQYLKDITKYVLTCSIGKLLSIIVSTIIGINYIMPLAFYLVSDLFMMLLICLLHTDKKAVHKTGSILMDANDVVSVAFNGVLLGMSMLFSFLMMLKWYSLANQFSAECIVLYWTIVFQTMIAVITWFKQDVKKFIQDNALLIVTIGLTLLAFIVAFRNTKVVILGVCMTALFCGLNVVYNKIFKMK